MPACERIHRELDGLVGRKVQIGSLPTWTHVHGRVAWTVVRGPYSELPGSWMTFMRAVDAAGARRNGPTGDVYACQPEDHTGDGESTLLTILYAPVE
ncbi:MAG TPA: hypothetical protein VMH78_07045 [Thermoplasmata archaeon]|nr:hypothetical protein [Thermoplasmata archaeon]